MAARITFFDDFTCVVNNHGIEVDYRGHGQQLFLFAHPTGLRQYFVETRSTKITLRNVILQVGLFCIMLYSTFLDSAQR
jgi:hypothetical protein